MPYNFYLNETLKPGVKELQEAVKGRLIGAVEANRIIHEALAKVKASILGGHGDVDTVRDDCMDVGGSDERVLNCIDNQMDDNNGNRNGNHSRLCNGDHDGNHVKEENENKESSKENKDKEEREEKQKEIKKSKKSAFFQPSFLSSVQHVAAGSTPPTLEQVQQYHGSLHTDCCTAEEFYDSYAAYGWKNKEGRLIEDWQAELRNWVRHRSRQKAGAKQGADCGCDNLAARPMGKNREQRASKKVDLPGWLQEHYPLPQQADDAVSETVVNGIAGMLEKYSLENQCKYVSSKVLEEARAVNCISFLQSYYGRPVLMHILMLHLDSLAVALGSSKAYRTPEHLEQIAGELLRSHGDLRLSEMILAITQCKRGKYDVFHDKLTLKNMCKAMEQFKDWRCKELHKLASVYLN